MGGEPPGWTPMHFPPQRGQLMMANINVPVDIMLEIPTYQEDESTRQYMCFLNQMVTVNVSEQVEYHRQNRVTLQCEQGYTAAFNAALLETFRQRNYLFIKQCQFKKVPSLHNIRGAHLTGPVLIDKQWGKRHIERRSGKQEVVSNMRADKELTTDIHVH